MLKDAYSLFDEGPLSRANEMEDEAFYSVDRFVNHLDERARKTVAELIGALVVEEKPAILDLMAGWDSHLPIHLNPARSVGLGLNVNELFANEALDERFVRDLNRDPRLPFEDAAFDLVLNTVSVDYLTRPVEVFREVARVLKPGGLFLVIFSNRLFPEKAVRIWIDAGEQERLGLVEAYFKKAGGFSECRTFASTGRPRPPEDKYAPLGLPSDPIYAVYAERSGGREARDVQKALDSDSVALPPKDVIEHRKRLASTLLQCPYCNARMLKWAVPQTPFTEWDVPFMYICFNDECPYLVRGWRAMERQGIGGFSYRAMYNLSSDAFYPVPVASLKALREGILE